MMHDASTDRSLRASPLAGSLPPADRLPGAADNAILDCTRVERFGLRGPGTAEWLQSAGLALPKTVNGALALPGGIGILRLGHQEVLLTGPVGGSPSRPLREAWEGSALDAKGYDAYRDEGWAWFVVSGPLAPLLMSRISMTDLRPRVFGAGRVAQTRVLQQDSVVARFDRFGAVSYDLFLDIASAEFALEMLTDTADGIGASFTLAEILAGA